MSAAPLRLGAPPYLAARPCIEGLGDDPQFSLSLGTPAELIDRLRAGELDAALVSSIEGFRRPGYRYVPPVAIAADGDVRSVLLLSRKPLAECAALALDPASRSGAALAQVVLRAELGRPIEVIELSLGSDPSRAGADCWVRIGDAAIREARAGGARVHDLAALWKRQTGLPFVFAVWLVRPNVGITAAHASALRAARDRGVARAASLAREAARALELPEELLRSYLTDACRYDLDAPGMREGLAEFHRRAAALGLADPRIEPAPV